MQQAAKPLIVWVILIAWLSLWAQNLQAQYTLLLKNGRRIIVQSYREEGEVIKFYGLGGEIGIAKAQIETILKGGEAGERAMALGEAPLSPFGSAEGNEKTVSPRSPEGQVKVEREERAGVKEKALTPGEQLEEQRAREEKEYQKKVKEITEQIKAARERYALVARGTGGSEPSFFTSEEAFKGQQDDLLSRLRDAQYNPLGPSDAGAGKILTPSPFTGVPPVVTEVSPSFAPPAPSVSPPLPEYSGRQKELSDLRNQIGQLMKERASLIEEMKERNFDTGSLFLD